MGDNIWSTVLLLVLMGGALYFLMIRPQQKRTKEQQNLMSSLEPGSRVMLLSGIFATVKYLGDKQAVVEIAPGVEMTVDKRAISTQPVTDEFEYADDADAAEPAAEEPEATEPVASEAAAKESATAEPVATSPASEPGDVDVAWDAPGTEKN
jgi:preprotein translocase subunit YajC